MDQDAEHLRLLSIFHYIVGGLGRGLFFLSAALHYSWSHFYICRAPRHPKTRRRTATRIYWMDFCRNWFVLIFARDCDRDLHLNCGSLACETHSVLVRIRYGLHRMPLPSLRNNSWGIHNYRPFTRVREDVVFGRCERARSDAVLAVVALEGWIRSPLACYL